MPLSRYSGACSEAMDGTDNNKEPTGCSISEWQQPRGKRSRHKWPFQEQLFPSGPVQAFQTGISRQARLRLGSVIAKIILFLFFFVSEQRKEARTGQLCPCEFCFLRVHSK